MLSGLVVALHVLTVMWLVGGIIARDVVYSQAARAAELPALRALVELGSRIERLTVRPATFAVLLGGLLAAITRGWPILGFLQGGAHNWVLASLLLFLTFIPLVVWVFLPRGRVFRRAYETALAEGSVTPELRAALNDRAVAAARGYELAMIAALTILMVLRPF